VIIFHDPHSADYGSALRPEQPARVIKTVTQLKSAHPEWTWREPSLASETDLLLAHHPTLLRRLQQPPDFDEDTPYFPGIYAHARRAVGAALDAMEVALVEKSPVFSLMRPPGHHATADQAMGFCYLNQIAIAVLAARRRGVARVAVWDFDAHHGNGTESILDGHNGILFCSVHQFPGYPGTGTRNTTNCHNWPVAPNTRRELHLNALQQSWATVLAFRPELVLVSAGFDAYVDDPITAMTLEARDFATLGEWLGQSNLPAAAILEGGYSPDLPSLIDGFLSAWQENARPA
jgi:acetoin utilization deacetylase AcuC-like enzyme